MTVAQAAAMLGQPVVKGDNWYPRPPRLPCFVFCGNVVLWNGAEAVVTGLRDERFLILPHPEVATFEQRRAADPAQHDPPARPRLHRRIRRRIVKGRSRHRYPP